MEKIVEWRDLATSFYGRLVIAGFSGYLERGERLRMKGLSGCGKTTFLQIVLGVAVPDSETIEIPDFEGFSGKILF